METGFLPEGRSFAKVAIGNLFRMQQLQSAFFSTPLDQYVPRGIRFKDTARFRMCHGSVEKTAHGKLFHPINAQTYGGKVSRDYPEIPANDIEDVMLLAKFFIKNTEISSEHEILLQRQRIVNDNAVPSLTVQEGPHKDGVQKLGIFCVSRVNIEGGVSLLYNDRQEIIFAGILEPGELLLINDSQVWHNTTSISRCDASRPGYRDIIILTWPACREADVAAHA